MKKVMILAAAAALVLAGCSKNEITENPSRVPESIPIGFSNYVPRSTDTKANSNYVADGSALPTGTNGHFGVYAWAVTTTSTAPWTAGPFFGASTPGVPGFMSNVDVTFGGNEAGTEGTANTYSPTRYWPAGDTPDGLSFIAYYPYNATSPLGNGSFGAKTFTVAAAAADQIDFMVSNVVADQWYGHTNSSNSHAGTVDLTFHHLLTKVRFYFVTDNSDENTTVTLTNARLQGIYKTNTLTTGYTAGASANSGTTALDWSSSASDADSFDVTINGTTPSSSNVVLSTTATACANGDVFLMVPQTIAASQQKITLTWTVTTSDVTTTNVKTIDLYDITAGGTHIDWEKNKQVSYTITIGPKPIRFTATVDGWDTETTGSLTVN